MFSRPPLPLRCHRLFSEPQSVAIYLFSELPICLSFTILMMMMPMIMVKIMSMIRVTMIRLTLAPINNLDLFFEPLTI